MGQIEGSRVPVLDQLQEIQETNLPSTVTEDDDSSAVASRGSAGESIGIETDDLEDHEPSEDAGAPPVATVTLTGQSDDDSLSYDGDPEEDQRLEQLPDEEEELWSTPMENQQMDKARTYYIYKRQAHLLEALANHEAVTGIITRDDKKKPKIYLVYKIPGKQFGWYEVSFNDLEGSRVCGLWYAPLTVQEGNAPPSSTSEITKVADMAFVAIPLRYPLGDQHPDAFKYCVLTNWWRERDQKGDFRLPSLPFELYQESGNSANSS